MKKITTDDYQLLKQWICDSEKTMFEDFSKKVCNLKDNINLADMSVLKKILNACGYEEFKAYIEYGEIPAVVLTAQEMKVAMGGAGPKVSEQVLDIIKGQGKTIFNP